MGERTKEEIAVTDRVVDAVVVALNEFSEEELRSVIEARSWDTGWLPTMLDEYLSVWR